MPVLKRNILGTEIWEASDEEIRALWNKTPKTDRHRFWSNDEVTAHMSDDLEQIAECLRRKKEKPGRLE